MFSFDGIQRETESGSRQPFSSQKLSEFAIQQRFSLTMRRKVTPLPPLANGEAERFIPKTLGHPRGDCIQPHMWTPLGPCLKIFNQYRVSTYGKYKVQIVLYNFRPFCNLWVTILNCQAKVLGCQGVASQGVAIFICNSFNCRVNPDNLVNTNKRLFSSCWSTVKKKIIQ